MSIFDTHHEDTDEEETNTNGETQESNEEIAFIAKLRSSRTLASILKTIHFADVIIIHFELFVSSNEFSLRMPYFVRYQLELKSSSKINNVFKAMLLSIHVFLILLN